MQIIGKLEKLATRLHSWRWVFILGALAIGFLLQTFLHPNLGRLFKPIFGIGGAAMVWLWALGCLCIWAHPERGVFNRAQQILPWAKRAIGVLYLFALMFLIVFALGGFFPLLFGFGLL